jgi:hypothetical protein
MEVGRHLADGLPFVRGHCGWDIVTLLPEGSVAPADELEAALRIASAPIDGGLEVGWMGRGEAANEIVLRMVSTTAKDWIPMCGGMTQVIGKALVETFLRDHFSIDVSRPSLVVELLTPSGVVPITIEIVDRRCRRVLTTMDNYASHLYRDGIAELELDGVRALQVGAYVVVRIEELEKAHPRLDFTRRDPGPHLDVVNGVLRAFGRHLGVAGVNGMLFDARPEGTGQFRVFPRFYSEDLAAARLPWEFQCGTGSIAVAVALVHQGHFAHSGRHSDTTFEWGSYRSTRDPYGIRTSQLHLEHEEGRVLAASFSHSVVEILSEGLLRLPRYGRDTRAE